jgi:DNA excision repair protein ERCC-3
MPYNPDNPIVVQGDRTILLEVNNRLYAEARDSILRFAELEKSPEYIHTYKITSLSLWNAAASGMNFKGILNQLEKYSKFDLPQNIVKYIKEGIEKYGKLKLIKEKEQLYLISKDKYIIQEILKNKKVNIYIENTLNEHKLKVMTSMRGHIKQALIKIGFPVEDLAGYIEGTPFSIGLKEITAEGKKLVLRDYQKEAAQVFYAEGSEKGGSGVIVLPCGAGKTITGMAVMDKLDTETLILTTNITAVRQWKQELLDKTNIKEKNIGEYSGEVKEIKPVTIATYQILTHRKNKNDNFVHLNLFSKKKWGLIIYDEVHMLPAPVFRMTAEIQAIRRLGLTATLVREDGMEEDVFSLIGPKKFDMPWKVLEKEGWIASAKCIEVRVDMPEDIKMDYAVSDYRLKFRIASENYKKIDVVYDLINKHKEDKILIIGQYLKQLKIISYKLKVPIITGKTKNEERIKLYEDFKKGSLNILVVSKVANFAIDLPDANVAIQVSGTFGSRQEEAQRLGRILRPKVQKNIAYFYSIVTSDSREQDFAVKRQMFLVEQGYKYYIKSQEEIGEDILCH